MTTERVYGCPVELSLELLGGKWKPVILARLKEEPLRYADLRRAIPALSDKVLTQRIGELVESGFVTVATSDGARRYHLTSRGETLKPVLQALHDWGRLAAESGDVRFRDEADGPPSS